MSYVGVDPSTAYIASASHRFGDRGTVTAAGVDDHDAETLGEFDVVIAKNVLHHIDDAQARKLFGVAAQVLAPTGRLVTPDAGFGEGQSRLSKFVVGQDRGANIRSDGHYVELAREFFTNAEATVHHDLLRVPYTHVILDCAVSTTTAAAR